MEINETKWCVWVGSVEVNDYYLTYNNARNLADKYIDDGYDDVILEPITEEEFYEWRLCTTCEKETIHDEHNVKYGCIPFVCRECKTRTIITGYEEEML